MKTENQTGKEGSFSRLAKLLFLCALLLALPARTADARFLSPDSWAPGCRASISTDTHTPATIQ
jgi:hypothetical protein